MMRVARIVLILHGAAGHGGRAGSMGGHSRSDWTLLAGHARAGHKERLMRSLRYSVAVFG